MWSEVLITLPLPNPKHCLQFLLKVVEHIEHNMEKYFCELLISNELLTLIRNGSMEDQRAAKYSGSASSQENSNLISTNVVAKSINNVH